MTITVGFLVFPGIQLLDLAGPYEIFSALPDGEMGWLGSFGQISGWDKWTTLLS